MSTDRETSETPPVRPPRGAVTAWHAVALVTFGLMAYANSFWGPFVLDDTASIAENTSIRRLWPLTRVLSPPADAGVGGRPLTNLSLALNHAWGGLDVRGYHAVNLAIHLAAALTLFGLVRRTLQLPRTRTPASEATFIAFATALLWLVHPLQTEAVTYLSQRTESLVGLFYLLTIYGGVRGTQSAAALRWRWLAIAASAAGMATKEVMVTAPVLMLLYDRTFLAGSFREAWQQRRMLYVGLMATWLVLLFSLVDVHERGVGYQALNAWNYALIESRAVVLYLRLALWPSPLVFDYGMATPPALSAILPFAAATMTLVVATGFALWRRPVAGFLGATIFIVLAPTSSFVPVAGQPIAEHRMYLPLAAIAVAAAIAIHRAFGRYALAATLVVAGILATATWHRNRVYADPVLLWQDTVAKQPTNARAHAALGAAYLEKQRLPLAIAALQEAVRLDPASADAHNNLATALVDMNRSSEAVAHFSASLRLRPATASTHYNFGNALLSLGRTGEAIAQQQQALLLQPRFPEAECGLADALARAGRVDDSLQHYRTTLQLSPELAAAHYGLALALGQLGRVTEAIPHFEAALRAVPNSVEAHYNFGNLLFAAERYPDAALQFLAAVQLRPDFAEAHNNLANAFALSGRSAEAIAQYEIALKLRPDLEAARANLDLLRKAASPSKP